MFALDATGVYKDYNFTYFVGKIFFNNTVLKRDDDGNLLKSLKKIC